LPVFAPLGDAVVDVMVDVVVVGAVGVVVVVCVGR
jgi:hypothetical protein